MNWKKWQGILSDFSINMSAGSTFAGFALFIFPDGTLEQRTTALVVYLILAIVFLAVSYRIKQ